MSIRQPLGSLVHENMSTPTEIMSQPPQSQTVTQPLLTPLKDKEGHVTTATAQTMHTTTMNKLNTNDTTAKPPASPLMVKSHPQSQTALAETPLRPRDHMTESRSAMRFHTSASTGMRSVRHDENNQMMPPYPMSVGREQTHPPRHSHSHALGHGHGSAHLHRHPQPLPPPRFSPYPYSPTPNMTSGYHHASSPHHPQSVHADRSHGRYPVSHGPPSHAQSGPHRNHAFVSTPTPSSRSYRSDATNPNMTPSYGSAGSATPASIYTPLAYPLSPTSSSSGELVMLPRPRGSPLKLHGLEPAATWTEDAPPHLWLAGEKGDVAAPCSMTDPQEKEWKKLVAYTKNFKSHNPWDYGIKENREHFNDNHKKYLELQWILDSNPSTTARERLGAWLGVATRRITVFYQNRRQMMSKTKPTAAADRSRRGSSSTATDAGVFGEMMMSGRKTTQSTPMHGHGTVGPVRLNTNRGLLDDNWKWTPSTSSSPLPPPDREVINQLAIVYAIITGELDEYCYHHYYITNRVRQVSGTSSSPTLMSDDSSYDDVQVPAIHYPVGQTRRLEDIMQEREAELPIRRKSPPGPQYDERGSIVNLPAMLPTDIPSEDIDPDHLDQHQSHANKRHGSRSQRGERVPDFAMRTETTIAGARASAVNLYHCSNRAKELAKRRGSSLSASGSPLPRTQSLPSIGHPLSGAALPSLANVIAGSTNSSSSGNSAVSRPKLQARGVRQSYPSLKPIINTKPQNSWTRSHSALDLPTLSRYPGGSRSQSHSRTGSEVASDTVIEEEDEKRPGGGEMDMSEAAELLMGMSRATDSTSGSGSGGSQ